MPNFRLLVHSDFCEDSSSFSSSCDKGKTKSTHSIRLRLEFDNNFDLTHSTCISSVALPAQLVSRSLCIVLEP